MTTPIDQELADALAGSEDPTPCELGCSGPRDCPYCAWVIMCAAYRSATKESKEYLYKWHGAECAYVIMARERMDDMTAVACELVEREAEYQRAHDNGCDGAMKGHAYKLRAEAAEALVAAKDAEIGRWVRAVNTLDGESQRRVIVALRDGVQ